MATGAAPGVSKTTKHQNFGSGRPHNASHPGYQACPGPQGAQSYANSFMSANMKAKKTKGKRQANTLGGSRAGG